MPSTSTTELRALNTTYRNDFQAGYDSAAVWSPQISTEVPSSTRSNTYGWLKQIPRLREWLGPRVVEGLAASSYQIVNKKYEHTIGVSEDDWEDDQLGQYRPVFRAQGVAAAKWFDDLMLPLLENGTTDLCFDGTPFFGSTHPLDPAGNQDNDFALALNATNLFTVRSNMAKFTGENGKRLGVTPKLLIYPTALAKAALEAVSAPLNSAGATNVANGIMTPLEIPELTDDTTWYVVDNTKGIMPFIRQVRRNLRMQAKVAPTEENVFWNGELVWGMDGRGNAGYGLWFLAARSKP